jgi:cellobiose-specific phosphotransferase system component IIC
MLGGMEKWIWRQYQDAMPLHTYVLCWDVLRITMKNHIHRNHITLQLKLKKIPLQLLCNYPLGIITIMQLSP